MSSVTDLLNTLDSLDIEIALSDGELECFGAPHTLTDELKQQISRLEPQIIAFFQAAASPENPHSSTHEALCHPVSYSQQRIWYVEALQPDIQNYHIPFGFEFVGDLNLPKLEQSLKCVIERHQILRSKVFMQGEALVQEVMSDFTPPFDVIDASPLSDALPQARIDEVIHPFLRQPFDLNGDVLLRLTVVRVASNRYYLIFKAHHIAFDGWSMAILLSELNHFYRSQLSGHHATLPPLEQQYKHIAHHQRQQIHQAPWERQCAYWRAQLHDLPPLHSIPTDNPRRPVQAFSGASELLVLDETLTQRLEALCHSHSVTLFMLLETALTTLYSAISQDADVVIGTPVAGRLSRESEALIGCFSNTLVLRTQVKPHERFCELLQRNKLTLLDAFEHQAVPFDLLVEELQPQRSLSHAPLIQLLFTFQEEDHKAIPQTGVLNALPDHQIGGQKTVKCDLEAYATRVNGQLRLRFDYDTDLFLPQTIQGLLQAYHQLLHRLVADEQQSVAQLVDIDAISQLTSAIRPVKVNGYPIQLDRIQHVLDACPQIARAKVSLTDDENGQRTLRANVETYDDQRPAIQAYLKAHLPDYLIPPQLHPWAGQTDVPLSDTTPAVDAAIQQRLVMIWAELLKRPVSDLSPDDDFFALGGHSLLVVRLIAKIRSQFNCELALDNVYDTPTLQELAQVINDVSTDNKARLARTSD
ncbi:condensation domain-containing protein [Vibrio sp. 10N.261.46.E12]|uniref:condensation domain-containing protein n=1 Tax=unclassified Vibrio TaxID=2614977 RepID=UPI0009785A65|nr:MULTISPECIES: condensation domain-containing protein [unclassified Vibrio]OMO37674.1 hypothetical protein BH584_21480 [Vibrio sp. 10N.261.45.E1]PMJ26252.1 hypothetical protein BCU27_09480 [Vibrio sp. 10N.286.45.B6]PML86981.1 hypothetical protein BCT66_13060 [Vibrio sp. 10N.261.49.E11]PMM78638.1 hypothetical protein BCT48_01095 [Vibrio sp. 10N.261.46.F12]PMM85758.1 hypothetical protein BCT46_08840 [Vibrio sp. 10N.261.46.E8]